MDRAFKVACSTALAELALFGDLIPLYSPSSASCGITYSLSITLSPFRPISSVINLATTLLHALHVQFTPSLSGLVIHPTVDTWTGSRRQRRSHARMLTQGTSTTITQTEEGSTGATNTRDKTERLADRGLQAAQGEVGAALFSMLLTVDILSGAVNDPLSSPGLPNTQNSSTFDLPSPSFHISNGGVRAYDGAHNSPSTITDGCAAAAMVSPLPLHLVLLGTSGDGVAMRSFAAHFKKKLMEGARGVV